MSLETQELNRLRQAFAEDCGCLGDCPSPEALWAGAHGELGHHELRALLDHVSACADCAEDWRLAAELGKGAVKVAAREERRVATVSLQRIRPWAAALAAVLVLRGGRIAATFGEPARKLPCHSIRKSLLSALIGIAVEEGRIDLSASLDQLGMACVSSQSLAIYAVDLDFARPLVNSDEASGARPLPPHASAIETRSWWSPRLWSP